MTPELGSDASVVAWDPDREVEIDRRVERRLLWREFVVLLLIAGLIVLRVLFVHGS